MRFNPYGADREGYHALVAWNTHLIEGPLDASVRILVEVRVSQINGCVFCLETHVKEALEAGIPQRKLDDVAEWRESSQFSDPERAALGLAEAMTRIPDGRRVDDATWAAARDQFDDKELAALLYVIGMINAFNLINVAIEKPGRG
jgi:AhpD family alkylhydroperoxidase